MRHGRAKQARKTLQFFQRTINIHTPYNILMDGTFTVAMLQSKLPLMERLDRLLQHGTTYQLYITQSSVQELEMLAKHSEAKEGENIFKAAQDWARDNCQVLLDMPKVPEQLEDVKLKYEQQQQKQKGSNKQRRKSEMELTVAQNDMLRLVTDAVASRAGKKSNLPPKITNAGGQEEGYGAASKEQQKQQHRVYFVATQDETVLGLLRYFPVPLIRLARGSVLLLEQPSKTIQYIDRRVEQQKWNASTAVGTITDQEKELLQVVTKQQKEDEKKEHQRNTSMLEFGRRTVKKRKAKGPNPLSCKKKATNDNDGGKRHRKKQKSAD